MSDTNHTLQILNKIHNQYNVFNERLWNQEIHEQTMSVMFLNGDECVLEIGACIGRNTIVIGHILQQKGGRLTSIESNPTNVHKLKNVIAKSGLNNIDICEKPLSKKRMIVNKWNSKIIEDDQQINPDWTEVETITLDTLKHTYGNLNYNTLVIDCEGAFFDICKEFPEIINNINKVIIENDFENKEHGKYVHNLFHSHNLEPIYTISLDKPRRLKERFPFHSTFWQVWAKKNN